MWDILRLLLLKVCHKDFKNHALPMIQSIDQGFGSPGVISIHKRLQLLSQLGIHFRLISNHWFIVTGRMLVKLIQIGHIIVEEGCMDYVLSPKDFCKKTQPLN